MPADMAEAVRQCREAYEARDRKKEQREDAAMLESVQRVRSPP